MAGPPWQTLVQVREAVQRSVQQQVARDRQTVDLTERQVAAAQGDWLRWREAGARHRQALQRSADAGAASVGWLRQAGQWDRVLVERLAHAAHAVHEAEGVHAQAQRLLAVSRAELRRASAQLEKARHLDEAARRTAARVHERRLEDLADEAALQRRGLSRRA